MWIVDDEDAVRDSLAILLESSGIATRSFASGAALLAVELDACDCLLVDLRMPDMGGLEVLAELQARGHPPPVIIMTGHGDALIERQVKDAGAFAMLDKPIAEETLLGAIGSAFGESATLN